MMGRQVQMRPGVRGPSPVRLPRKSAARRMWADPPIPRVQNVHGATSLRRFRLSTRKSGTIRIRRFEKRRTPASPACLCGFGFSWNIRTRWWPPDNRALWMQTVRYALRRERQDVVGNAAREASDRSMEQCASFSKSPPIGSSRRQRPAAGQAGINVKPDDSLEIEPSRLLSDDDCARRVERRIDPGGLSKPIF